MFKKLILLVAILAQVMPWQLAFSGGDDTVPTISAQGGSCGDVIEAIFETIRTTCLNLGPNMACYGPGPVEVTFKPGADATFASPGDRVSLSDIATLTTFPFDISTGDLGVVVMNVQTETTEVILMMTGDAHVENVGDERGLAPMQAFYFDAGTELPECEQAPESSVFILVPHGSTASFIVNDVEMDVSSALLLGMLAAGMMSLNLVRGHVTIRAGDREVNMSGGEMRVVHLNRQDGTGRQSGVDIDCGRFPSPRRSQDAFRERCYSIAGSRYEPESAAPPDRRDDFRRACRGTGAWGIAPTDEQGDVYGEYMGAPIRADNPPPGGDISRGSGRFGGRIPEGQSSDMSGNVNGSPHCGGPFGFWGGNELSPDNPNMPDGAPGMLQPGRYMGSDEQGAWWSSSDSPVYMSSGYGCSPAAIPFGFRTAGMALPRCQESGSDSIYERWFALLSSDGGELWTTARDAYMAQMDALADTDAAPWMETAWQAANETNDWTQAVAYLLSYAPDQVRHQVMSGLLETLYDDDYSDFEGPDECLEFLYRYPDLETVIALPPGEFPSRECYDAILEYAGVSPPPPGVAWAEPGEAVIGGQQQPGDQQPGAGQQQPVGQQPGAAQQPPAGQQAGADQPQGIGDGEGGEAGEAAQAEEPAEGESAPAGGQGQVGDQEQGGGQEQGGEEGEGETSWFDEWLRRLMGSENADRHVQRMAEEEGMTDCLEFLRSHDPYTIMRLQRDEFPENCYEFFGEFYLLGRQVDEPPVPDVEALLSAGEGEEVEMVETTGGEEQGPSDEAIAARILREYLDEDPEGLSRFSSVTEMEDCMRFLGTRSDVLHIPREEFPSENCYYLVHGGYEGEEETDEDVGEGVEEEEADEEWQPSGEVGGDESDEIARIRRILSQTVEALEEDGETLFDEWYDDFCDAGYGGPTGGSDYTVVQYDELREDVPANGPLQDVEIGQGVRRYWITDRSIGTTTQFEIPYSRPDGETTSRDDYEVVEYDYTRAGSDISAVGFWDAYSGTTRNAVETDNAHAEFTGAIGAAYNYRGQVTRYVLIEGHLLVVPFATHQRYEFDGPADGETALLVTVGPDGFVYQETISFAEALLAFPPEAFTVEMEVNTYGPYDPNITTEYLFIINTDGSFETGLSETEDFMSPLYYAGADVIVDVIATGGQVGGMVMYYDNGELIPMGEPAIEFANGGTTLRVSFPLIALLNADALGVINLDMGALRWLGSVFSFVRGEVLLDRYPDRAPISWGEAGDTMDLWFTGVPFGVEYQPYELMEAPEVESAAPEQETAEGEMGEGEGTPPDEATCSATLTANSNVRNGPGTAFGVQTTLPGGTQVNVVGQNAVGDWYHIRYDGEDGWIAGFLLELSCPAGIALPVEQ